MPRESAFGRLLRHFHEHPKGRLHEALFWSTLGIVLGGITWLAWSQGWLNTPLALVAAIIAICFVGWAFLPHPRAAAAKPLPPGKRGQLAQQKNASKRPPR